METTPTGCHCSCRTSRHARPHSTSLPILQEDKTRVAVHVAAHTAHGCPGAIRFIFINTTISRGHLSLVVPTADISPSPSPSPYTPKLLPFHPYLVLEILLRMGDCSEYIPEVWSSGFNPLKKKTLRHPNIYSSCIIQHVVRYCTTHVCVIC